ncbi:MAG: Crp/Fnr family transcriptional regulator [Tissierellia bacterium]|nr:Crp/Fnr family transcriptional regulator [Tissierellia bacterium]
MINNEDLAYLKEQLGFWDKLSQKEKQLLVSNVYSINYKKGENLHGRDKDCVGHILVKSGELRVYILSEEGRDITLYRLTPGETCVLSASCVMNYISFDVLIDAEQDTEVLLLNIGAFGMLKEGNIHVENYAYKVAADRFSDIMWAMEQILFASFDKRLAVFLYDESARNKSNKINLTHEQIAKYVGSAREVVSRTLKNFESQGILKLSRGNLNIINKEKLRELI